MGMVNPCCMKLELGVKIIAILNMVFPFLGLIACVILLVNTNWGPSTIRGTEKQGVGQLLITFSIICLALLANDLRLFVGALQRRRKKCQIWFIIQLILVILFIICNLIRSRSSILEVLVIILVQGYQLTVVYAFMAELKKGEERQIQIIVNQRELVSGNQRDLEFGDLPPPYEAKPAGRGPGESSMA